MMKRFLMGLLAAGLPGRSGPRGRHGQDRARGRQAQPRPRRSRVQRRLPAAPEVPERDAGHRRRGREGGLAEGRDGLRRREVDRLLHGRRRRPPDDPGRPSGQDREAHDSRASAWSACTTPSRCPRASPATGSSTGSAATTRPASRPTRTGTPTSRACPSTRSRAA